MGDRAAGLPALLPMTEEEQEKGTGRAAAAGEQSEGARASEAAQTNCDERRSVLYPPCITQHE